MSFTEIFKIWSHQILNITLFHADKATMIDESFKEIVCLSDIKSN